MWVSNDEYIDLERGIIYADELGRPQEYIPYITLKSNTAYSIWNGIYIRCYKEKNVYEGAFMCGLWKDDKDAFAEWWASEYYECDGESMAHINRDNTQLCRINEKRVQLETEMEIEKNLFGY